MDDTEIRKLWLEIQDAQKHPDVEGAAIHLYRMAFQEGYEKGREQEQMDRAED